MVTQGGPVHEPVASVGAVNREAIRRVLLAIGVALTVPLPIVMGVLLAAGRAVEPFIVILGILTMIFAAVGATIVWRRPGDRVGILLLVGSLMLTSAAAVWPWLASI